MLVSWPGAACVTTPLVRSSASVTPAADWNMKSAIIGTWLPAGFRPMRGGFVTSAKAAHRDRRERIHFHVSSAGGMKVDPPATGRFR